MNTQKIKQYEIDESEMYIVEVKEGEPVTLCCSPSPRKWTHERAQFIVLAVNNFARLREASKCALKELNKLGATCQTLERVLEESEG